jgi:hypothetical protein
MVGDVIRCGQVGHLGYAQHTIFDFERNHIFVGPGEDDYIEFSANSMPPGGIIRCRGTNHSKITDPAKLWVKRDPQQTKALVNMVRELEEVAAANEADTPYVDPHWRWRRLCEL